MKNYERTATNTLERADGGKIAGILATDGEASDGHILDIRGGDLQPGAPMLFGHDDFSGSRNLGSWDEFEVGGGNIRATGSIELGGDGEGKAWRNDVAHMVGKGHINALSIRWDPIDDPIRRTSLPKEHAAHVGSKEGGRKEYGLFFPRWKMLEGSVVTIGSDPSALIGRMAECEGALQRFWRHAVNECVADSLGGRIEDAVVGVQIQAGEVSYISREAYDAVLELANERLHLALDIYESDNIFVRREDVEEWLASDKGADARAEQKRNDSSTRKAVVDSQKEKERKADTLPAVTPRMVNAYLAEGLATARREKTADLRGALARAKGKTDEEEVRP